MKKIKYLHFPMLLSNRIIIIMSALTIKYIDLGNQFQNHFSFTLPKQNIENL